MNETPLVNRLRERMAQQGFKSKPLSLKAGLNATYVRDILNGHSISPRSAELAKIAEVLGCTLDDLTSTTSAHVPSVVPPPSNGPSGDGLKRGNHLHTMDDLQGIEVAIIHRFRSMEPLEQKFWLQSAGVDVGQVEAVVRAKRTVIEAEPPVREVI